MVFKDFYIFFFMISGIINKKEAYGMKKATPNIFFILIFIFILAGFALAQEFSADIAQTANHQVFKGKVFVGKQKMRMEMPEAITITRMDKNVAWIIMPQEQMYMEQPFNPMNMPATAQKAPGEVERQFLGSEMVDGKMTDKYRITYQTGGQRWVSLQWIAKGLDMPVKTAAEDGSWSMEYKNIKIGAQPDALFEVPAGYRKFSYGMGISSFSTGNALVEE